MLWQALGRKSRDFDLMQIMDTALAEIKVVMSQRIGDITTLISAKAVSMICTINIIFMLLATCSVNH
jgi:hypothetical protein